MNLVANTNLNLVLVELEASTTDGPFEFRLMPEIPIVAFDGDGKAIALINPTAKESPAKEGIEVLDGWLADFVVKDKASGQFFSQSNGGALCRSGDSWSCEQDLKQSARQALYRNIVRALAFQRGGLDREVRIKELEEMTRILNGAASDLEHCALCWFCGAEGEINKAVEVEVEAEPAEVLAYFQERGFLIPPRLLAAVEQQNAA